MQQFSRGFLSHIGTEGMAIPRSDPSSPMVNDNNVERASNGVLETEEEAPWGLVTTGST